MTERFEAAWERVERGARRRGVVLGGRDARGARLRGGRRRGRAVPVEHVHGDAARRLRAGARVEFVDCNREDLCMSFDDFEAKAERHQAAGGVPRPHRRPHRVRRRADRRPTAREQRDLPDRGLRPRPRRVAGTGARPGTWGDAGVYSLYATKTISTGEGGVLVSRRPEVLEYARAFRNYGKPDYEVHGLNFRMSEFTAALGLIQIERMPEIVAWKNDGRARASGPAVPEPARAPRRDGSGLYKYIVFDWLERSTGRVYDEPCHRIIGHDGRSPEYRLGRAQPFVRSAVLPARRGAVTDESPRHRRIGVHRLARGRQAAARGHEPVIYDLRPSPWHRIPPSRSTRCSARSPTARRSSARCTAATRSPTWPRSPTSTTSTPSPRTPSGSTRAGPWRCSRPRAGRASSGSCTRRRSGCTRTARTTTSTRTRCCPPPSHLYTSTKLAGELYCKAYQELYGIDYTILRFGIPYGPRAREAAVDAGVRRQGAARRAADARRRRQPVAAVRVRRGPCRRRRAGPRRGRRPTASTTSPPTRTSRSSRSRVRVQELLGDVEIVYTPARPGDFGGKDRLLRAGRARARLDGARRRSREGVAGTSSGGVSSERPPSSARPTRGDPGRRARRGGPAAQDPDHLRRHRRGPRPARPRGRPRVPRRGPGRTDLDRQRPARDGLVPDRDCCARTRSSCSAGCRGCSTSSTGCS